MLRKICIWTGILTLLMSCGGASQPAILIDPESISLGIATPKQLSSMTAEIMIEIGNNGDQPICFIESNPMATFLDPDSDMPYAPRIAVDTFGPADLRGKLVRVDPLSTLVISGQTASISDYLVQTRDAIFEYERGRPLALVVIIGFFSCEYSTEIDAVSQGAIFYLSAESEAFVFK